MSKASTGTLWFLPTQNVLQPASRSTVAIVAFSGGMCPRIAGKADCRFGDRAEPVLMVIAAGQEGRTASASTPTWCATANTSARSAASRSKVGILIRPP